MEIYLVGFLNIGREKIFLEDVCMSRFPIEQEAKDRVPVELVKVEAPNIDECESLLFKQLHNEMSWCCHFPTIVKQMKQTHSRIK